MKTHPLLDTVKAMMNLNSDHQLANALSMHHPTICKVRNRKLRVGAAMILAIHDACGMEIKHIKGLIEASKENA